MTRTGRSDRRSGSRAGGLAGALLAGTACCGLAAPAALAQTAGQPAYRQPDANGVDVTHGDFLMSFVEGSIGSGDAELALIRQREGNEPSQWDRITYTRTISGGTTTVAIALGGIRWERFVNGQSTLASGSTLSQSGSDHIYTAADGTRIVFSDPTGSVNPDSTPFCNDQVQVSQCTLLPSSITHPDGGTVDVAWNLWGACDGNLHPQWGVETCAYDWRLGGVSNSAGYRIEMSYSSGGQGGQSGAPASWYQRTSAEFFNDLASTSALAGVSYARPSAGVTEVTDTGGRVWRFTGSGDRVTAIRRPGAISDTTTIAYTSGIVTSVTNEGVTTGYSRSVSGSTGTMTITNALSQASTVVSDLNVGRPTSITDPLNRTTSYQYDSNGRLTRVTAPEGNYVQYTYDSRGNVTQTQIVPKSGSGLATITTSASFDSTCSNPVTCNSPNSTTDARGNTTDYTYDSTHGGVLTVTGPAPTSGATRPQTRYSYTLANGEYRLTGIAQCQTGSSCTGTADEAKTALAYDSNGNVTSSSSGNGSGTLTATNAMTYDAKGDLLTVDGPLSGTADTTRLRYNAARELVGTVGPDPDGGGSLKHRATRNTIDSTSGLLTKTEQGTVNSQSDSDWAAFSAAQAVEVGYDSNARPTVQKLVSGSTTYALTQASYDALGRPECKAQRMNPSEFASLPSSACTLGTQGSYGPDRIAKKIYDAAGQVTQVKAALGTSDEANEVTATYSSNGLTQTVTDAENNKTTYVHDGHDRLSQTQFPSATKGAGTSNSSDYEQLGYDANGNVTSFRNRANETIGFTFDALDRMTLKDLPGSEPDVSYTYDLLDRMTGASQTGHALTFTWDALGRNLTQVGPLGMVTSSFDVAGRRTRITHPDSFYVDQDHLVTGEATAIRENGATSGAGLLATFAYDDLGRRTSLTRGNGAVTSYAYDAVSRLQTLTHDLAGTANDLTLGFTYNPASQIHSTTRSNDTYAWGGHGSGTTSSTADGLNRLATHGGTGFSYDANGNLTSDGATTFAYDSENRLASASGARSGTLSYDPLGRLYRVQGGEGDFRIAYDGEDAILEAGVLGNVGRRFVHGPGTDEPLVWYAGSGTLDRRSLHSDERGSVVAVQNADSTVSVNRYDEYGIPAATNVGRFQYTGQRWLPQLQLHYYKARMYNPALGRFMQPDPIGYDDGMNLYAYVKGDPVNFTDPSGLETGCTEFTVTWIRILWSGPGPTPQPPGTITDKWDQRYTACSGSRRFMPEMPLGPGSGGADAGSGRSGNTPGPLPKRQSQRSIQQNLRKCGSGSIKFAASGGAVVTVLGGGSLVGTFSTAGGGLGSFTTDFFGFGLNFSLFVEGGTSPDIDTFTGWSTEYSGSIGSWGGSAAKAESTGRWSFTGLRAVSPISQLPFSATLASSYTAITSFICPK